MTSGDLTNGNETGSANLRIPVRGLKGNGTLEVSAEKYAGVWKFDSLVLEHGSEKMVIFPVGSASNC
jgi:hypothetical protein